MKRPSQAWIDRSPRNGRPNKASNVRIWLARPQVCSDTPLVGIILNAYYVHNAERRRTRHYAQTELPDGHNVGIEDSTTQMRIHPAPRLDSAPNGDQVPKVTRFLRSTTLTTVGQWFLIPTGRSVSIDTAGKLNRISTNQSVQ